MDTDSVRKKNMIIKNLKAPENERVRKAVMKYSNRSASKYEAALTNYDRTDQFFMITGHFIEKNWQLSRKIIHGILIH